MPVASSASLRTKYERAILSFERFVGFVLEISCLRAEYQCVYFVLSKLRIGIVGASVIQKAGWVSA